MAPGKDAPATYQGVQDNMYVTTNVSALNAQRNLAVSGMGFQKSVEKLSSGFRINRAADDAAGLSISEKLRSQIMGTAQAQRNAQDGVSMIQTAEGGLNEVHSMLQRIRELSVQGANDTLGTDERSAINSEVQALFSEIDAIKDRTKFNGQGLLNGNLATTRSTGTPGTLASSGSAGGGGNTSTYAISDLDVSGAKASTTYTLSASGAVLTLSDGTLTQNVTVNAPTGGNLTQTINFDKMGVKFTINATNSAGTGATASDLATALNTQTVITAATNGSAKYQVGADQGEEISVAFASMSVSSLGLTGLAITSQVTASALIGTVDTAIGLVSAQRASLGAAQNRLEHTIANLGVANENLTASESRIRDTDMSAEMVNFTKNQILQQAGTAILAQANQGPQSILSLLR
jgi:flagellin